MTCADWLSLTHAPIPFTKTCTLAGRVISQMSNFSYLVCFTLPFWSFYFGLTVLRTSVMTSCFEFQAHLSYCFFTIHQRDREWKYTCFGLHRPNHALVCKGKAIMLLTPDTVGNMQDIRCWETIPVSETKIPLGIIVKGRGVLPCIQSNKSLELLSFIQILIFGIGVKPPFVHKLTS